jgi:GNAT superfamily N-acetyltransferase
VLVGLEPGDVRWPKALRVLRELRPHLTDELFDEICTAGYAQGLRFTALYEDGICVAVAGWRVVPTTSVVRKLYVDDLCTSATIRSRGHGTTLLNALAERGRELGSHVMDLDTGVQRHEAHRFYLRERMHISAHHFFPPPHLIISPLSPHRRETTYPQPPSIRSRYVVQLSKPARCGTLELACSCTRHV